MNASTELPAGGLATSDPDPKREPWIRLHRRGLLAAALLLPLAALLRASAHLTLPALGLALRRFRGATLATALALAWLQATLTSLRLWALLPGAPRPAWRRVAHAFSLGQLANLVLPARAGDAFKAVLLQAPGREGEERVPLPQGAGAILADKVVDIGALMLLVALTGAYVPLLPRVVIPRGAAWMLAFALPLPLLFAAGRPRWLRLARFLDPLRRGLGGLADPARLGSSLFFAAGTWLSEVAALHLLAADQGLALSLPRGVFALAALNLAISIQLTFANVGPYEAAIVFALGSFGADLPSGLAVATVHHVIQLVGSVSWAAVIALIGARRETARHAAPDEAAAISRLAVLDAPDQWLIEVGCSGRHALEARARGMRTLVVDPDPDKLARIRDQVDITEPVAFAELRADRTFARVICTAAFDAEEHEHVLRTCCRMVAPGGRLVVAVSPEHAERLLSLASVQGLELVIREPARSGRVVLLFTRAAAEAALEACANAACDGHASR